MVASAVSSAPSHTPVTLGTATSVILVLLSVIPETLLNVGRVTLFTPGLINLIISPTFTYCLKSETAGEFNLPAD